MNKPPLFLCLCFTALLLASTAHGEKRQGKWEVGSDWGLSLPGGRSNDLQAASTNLQLSVDYHLTQKTAFGLELGHAFGHAIEGDLLIDFDQDGINDTLEADTGVDREVFQATPYVKFSKSSDWGVEGVRWVRSFIMLGAGWYHGRNKRGRYKLNGQTSTGIDLTGLALPLNARTDNNFGINLGVGFGSTIFKYYRLGLGLRYHRVFRKPDDADYWVPSLRLSRFFS